ncbi:MAG: hypothetical protein WDN00_08490 [Limisphaerales bacterium]
MSFQGSERFRAQVVPQQNQITIKGRMSKRDHEGTQLLEVITTNSADYQVRLCVSRKTQHANLVVTKNLYSPAGQTIGSMAAALPQEKNVLEQLFLRSPQVSTGNPHLATR